MRRSRWGAGAAALVALAAAACTTEPEARPADATTRSVASPTESPTESPTDSPAGSPTESPTDSPGENATGTDDGEPECTEPLVIARHHSRRPLRLSEQRARAVADGATGARLVSSVRAVVRDPSAVAVLPAHLVDPRVRVAVVDGVHPLKRPRAYPVRVEADECPPRPTTLTVVGDVMLGRGVASAAAGDHGRQLRPTAARLRAADVTVGNLESTLSRAGAPRQGGDSFAADPAVGPALADAGFDVLSLANNHAGDFGPLALRQTVTRLEAAGLTPFGAGRNLAAARRPAIVEVRGTRFGFVGFNAIGETPEAGPRTTGAVSVSMPPRTGPLDARELDRFLGDVRRLDDRVDVVVALPHWGTQYTNRPEPVQRRVARELVAAGVDLVVGGHPHWVQGVSTVGEALVAQSLGNFVFDMDFMTETMLGVVLETTWWGNRLLAAELAPYRMDASFTPRFVRWGAGLPTLRLLGATSGPAFRY
ncbi:MAG TPA: CapA family protein [Nocardioides sp.]|uniref:CapA family protein n=1 Tax=Nocardioides sp. TaxID=35761 RepID=UPI002D80C32B|nr:CapA family protein [Nocardioides sp.]HET6652176.1 CapA family protein [Nocardioides sp.]